MSLYQSNQPILNFTRLEHLLTQARTQHLPTNTPRATLPDHIKLDIEEEWWETIEDIFRKIEERRFVCRECRVMHDSEGVKRALEAVRREMEEWNVEEVDEVKVEEWEGVLMGIEMWYWEVVKDEHDGKEGVEVEDEKDDRRDVGHSKDAENEGAKIGQVEGISALLDEIER